MAYRLSGVKPDTVWRGGEGEGGKGGKGGGLKGAVRNLPNTPGTGTGYASVYIKMARRVMLTRDGTRRLLDAGQHVGAVLYRSSSRRRAGGMVVCTVRDIFDGNIVGVPPSARTLHRQHVLEPLGEADDDSVGVNVARIKRSGGGDKRRNVWPSMWSFQCNTVLVRFIY